MPAGTITLRTASLSDADLLSDFAAGTFALACPPHTTQEDIDRHVSTSLSPGAFRKDLTDPTVTMLIADAAGGVGGYAMLVGDVPPPDGPGGGRPAELRRIYVAERYHGTDVAGLLMSHTLTIARERGHDVVWLGTNQHNERALRFYRKSGFGITGNKTFRVGDSIEHDYVLLLRLDAGDGQWGPAQ